MGSVRSDLHAIAVEIFQFYASNGIELELQWIPRTEIEKADYISRVIGIDDWKIFADCFLSLEESWRVHSVDCSANYYTTKVCKFFSRIWNPSCSMQGRFFRAKSGRRELPCCSSCKHCQSYSLFARFQGHCHYRL